MKRSSLRWLILGLAVIVLVGYLLSRGLYIGSTIDVSMRQGEGKALYTKSCRYLYLDGVHGVSNFGLESPSREGAESTSCALLGNSS
jgi:hypothetical protein